MFDLYLCLNTSISLHLVFCIVWVGYELCLFRNVSLKCRKVQRICWLKKSTKGEYKIRILELSVVEKGLGAILPPKHGVVVRDLESNQNYNWVWNAKGIIETVVTKWACYKSDQQNEFVVTNRTENAQLEHEFWITLQASKHPAPICA